MSGPQRVTRSTCLPASADAVWHAMQQPASMLYVCRGLVGFPGLVGRTEPITEGEEGSGWLFLFHVLPLARYRIRVDRIDPTHRMVRTTEGGRALRRLEHSFSVEPRGELWCRYTDTALIDAGALTPVLAPLIELQYRYRQRRWRRLARRHLSASATHARSTT